MEEFTGKSSFCVVPWIALHLTPTGERRLCCVAGESPPEVSALSYEDFLRSDYMNNIRLQMMSGILPKECGVCARPNAVRSYRESLNDRYQHHLSLIKEHTSPNGEVKFSRGKEKGVDVVYFDYRSIACNFRCKICSLENSSSWMAQVGGNQEAWEPYYPRDYVDFLRQGIARSPYKAEFPEVIKAFPVEEIYFAGGEPLYSGTHGEVIDLLIESGRAGDISLFYNTNLSLSSSELAEWVEKWSAFKSVQLSCSLDGVGEVGEYIRLGLRYEKFLENYRYLSSLKSRPSIRASLDTTLTSLFFLYIREFSELILSLGSEFHAKAMMLGNRKSKFMRCEFLPRRIRRQLVGEWRDYFDSLPASSRDLLKGLVPALELVADWEEFGSGEYPKILRQIEIHDRQFPKEKKFADFLCVHPAVRAWFEQLSRRQTL